MRRTTGHRWWRAWLTAALLAAVVWACPPAAALDQPRSAGEAEAAEALPAPLQRVAVIGASATCGFGVEAQTQGPFATTTVPADLGTVVQAMMPDGSTVTRHCSIFFFTESVTVGPSLMTDALADDPTLIVAIDYLFWYGYGSRDADAGAIDEESDRLALLEKGLKQLERCTCPVVVGDFPNMEDAVGKMLSVGQLPRPATLKKLNERLRAWAKEHDNVVVAPLAELVESMKAGKEVRIGKEVWPAKTMKDVIQPDQLHPTVDGLVLMAQLALHEVDEASDAIDVDDFVFERAQALQRVSDLLERE